MKLRRNYQNLFLILFLVCGLCLPYATSAKADSSIYQVANQGKVTDSSGLRTFDGDIQYTLPKIDGEKVSGENDIVILRDVSGSFFSFFAQAEQILTGFVNQLDLTKNRMLICNINPFGGGITMATTLTNNKNTILTGIQDMRHDVLPMKCWDSGFSEALNLYEAQKGDATNKNVIFVVLSDADLLFSDERVPANTTFEEAAKIKQKGYQIGVAYVDNAQAGRTIIGDPKDLASSPDYFVSASDPSAAVNMMNGLLTKMTAPKSVETTATWAISDKFDLLAATATDETGQTVPVQISGNQIKVTTTHTAEKKITLHYQVKEKALLKEKTSIGQGTINSSLGEESIPEVFIDGGRTNTKPEITGADVTLKAGDTFDPLAGMQATDKEDGEITKNLQIVENPVNTNEAGTYTVKYQVTDSDGNVTIFERKVTVISNEVPVITGEKETTVKVGDSFDVLAGMQATDKEDGDLTNQLKVQGTVDTTKIGDYPLIYTVTDQDSNEATFQRVVHIVSNETPVITGEKETTVKVGDSFDVLAGMQATDKEDGDLTNQLKVQGQVNANLIGNYPLTYTVTDQDGNTTTFAREIHVVSNEAPIILGESQVCINPNSTFDPLANMQAMDKEDGELTAQLKITQNDVNTQKSGTYHVGYAVTDSDGNTTTFTKTVLVTEAPAIEASDQTLPQGATFNALKNVKATDKEDGDLTKQVKVKASDVNMQLPGVYHVTYVVTDKDGNSTEKTIQVTVNSLPIKSDPQPEPQQQVVSIPEPVEAIPKTGDTPMWPWSVAGSLLLLTGLGVLTLQKRK